MTTLTRRAAVTGCALALLAPTAASLAQEPPPADAVPVEVTVSAPSSVKKAALTKGVKVSATCAPGCSVQLSLSGPIGIVTQKTIRVADGATGKAKLKATKAQAKALKKGAKLTLVATATGADGGRGTASRSIRVR